MRNWDEITPREGMNRVIWACWCLGGAPYGQGLGQCGRPTRAEAPRLYGLVFFFFLMLQLKLFKWARFGPLA